VGKVTIDSTLSAELVQSTHPVEVFDSTGNSLGFFVPSKAYYVAHQSKLSNEELQRREQAGGRTWPEIRADLEKKYGAA
jgi:hypothetical protein